MNTDNQLLYNSIQDEIGALPLNEFMMSSNDENLLRSERIDQIIFNKTAGLDNKQRERIIAEFHSWGPLSSLFLDTEITEIIVNGPTQIWYEKDGTLHQHLDRFLSEISFRNCIERICQEAKVYASIEYPCIDGAFLDFRLSLIGDPLTRSSAAFCLRRHPKNPWNFDKLAKQGWCQTSHLSFFKKMVADKKNFLVIGSTGSGKTSVLNSFLELLPQNERVVVIEDTSEITLPNESSLKLLTREDPHGLLPIIDQSQLVRRSLRLRPDRIVMGEIRGAEAKDLLMALATGHRGSFCTLHANNAQQALIRLEMLIQMGAPQWSLDAIRRLIQLSLDYIIITERSESGGRIFKGAFRLSSLETHGFLVEQEVLNP